MVGRWANDDVGCGFLVGLTKHLNNNYWMPKKSLLTKSFRIFELSMLHRVRGKMLKKQTFKISCANILEICPNEFNFA